MRYQRKYNVTNFAPSNLAAIGASHHFAAMQHFGRFRGEAAAYRVPGRARPALEGAGIAAVVQGARDPCRRPAGRGRIAVADVRAAARHLAAARRLAGDRAAALRLLRHQAPRQRRATAERRGRRPGFRHADGRRMTDRAPRARSR